MRKLVANIKLGMKQNVEVFRAARDLALNPSLGVTFPNMELTYKFGKAIYHNDLVVKASGCAFALVDVNRNIFVDDKFMSLDDNTKQFIIYHEIGHEVYKHLENISKFDTFKRGIPVINKSVVNKEFEADNYAASIMGTDNVIEALKVLKSFSCVGHREINKRIKRLDGGLN